MDKDFFYEAPPEKMPEYLKTGLANASFIISMVNLLFFGMALSFVLSPVAIVLGIVSLAKRQGGKGFAIAGIIVSSVSLLIFGTFTALFMKIYPDMEYFIRNDTAIISEFEETGAIPEQFEKYENPEYDSVWKSMGYEDFKGFFEFFISIYNNASAGYEISPPGDDGEELVVLGYS